VNVNKPKRFSPTMAGALMLAAIAVQPAMAGAFMLATIAVAPRAPVRMAMTPGDAVGPDGVSFDAFEASFDAERSNAAFERPRTADSLRSYLHGAWTLKKATIYKVGGISGRFVGSCIFETFLDPRRGQMNPLHERGLLSYSEAGDFRPDSDPSRVFETRNRLMYDFSDPLRVDVYYDASDDRSPAAVVAGLIFDHSLLPETLQMAEAPGLEGPGAYSGKLDVEAAGAFLSTWGVQGDALEGAILSMFVKVGMGAAN